MRIPFETLLGDFEFAVKQKALKGSKEPESWAEIERNYREAKERVLLAVRTLYAAYQDRTQS